MNQKAPPPKSSGAVSMDNANSTLSATPASAPVSAPKLPFPAASTIGSTTPNSIEMMSSPKPLEKTEDLSKQSEPAASTVANDTPKIPSVSIYTTPASELDKQKENNRVKDGTSAPTTVAPSGAVAAAILRRKTATNTNHHLNGLNKSVSRETPKNENITEKFVKKKNMYVKQEKIRERSESVESDTDDGENDIYEGYSSKNHADSDNKVARVRRGSVTWRNRIPNPSGMHPYVQKRIEVAPEMLSRVLLKGEVIDSQFDCFYPYPASYPWYINLLLVFCTFGLYGFFLLGRHILRSCCTAECMNTVCSGFGQCDAPVYFRRMKMSITNLGRIILWSLEAQESCECLSCGLRYNFGINQSVKVLTTKQIRQISQQFEASAGPRALCCCCCCRDHQGSVDVYFNAFQENNTSSFLQTGTINDFFATTKAFASDLLTQVKDHTIGSGGSSGTSGAKGIFDRRDSECGDQKSPLMIRVVTNSGDMAYKNDVRSMLTDLAELQATLIAFLPTEAMEPWCNSDLMDAAAKERSAKIHFHNNIEGLQIVDNDGNVNLPAKLVPFTEGESVLGHIGQIGTMSGLQKKLNCLSLGLCYWLFNRYRKFERSAVLLTNKRIIEINIYQRFGTLPEDIQNSGLFNVEIRSLIPGQILSGYLYHTEESVVESALHTQGGKISMLMSPSKVQFGRKMQRVTIRNKPLDVDIKLMPSKYQHITNLKEYNSSNKRDIETGVATGKQSKKNIKEYSLRDAEMDSRSLGNVPLQDNEEIIYRFKGASEWRPCWQPAWIENQCSLICCCRPMKPFKCSFATPLGRCLRPLASFLTCGFRPRKKFPEIVITSTTIYYNASFYSNPPIDMGDKGCVTSIPKGYFVSWIPIRSFDDHEVTVRSHGVFNVGKCTCCGLASICSGSNSNSGEFDGNDAEQSGCILPLPHCSAYSEYRMKLGTSEGFSYRFHAIVPDQNWIKNFRLGKMQALLSVVQVCTIMS